MQKLILLFIFFLAGKASFSQQQYFVYIQSEDKQPFYVLLNGKTYSSSEYGHVILSKLADSSQHISVGFPKKVFPEQIFTLSINKKDAGYQLKNLGAKGWGLFNLQTLSLVMSESNASLEKKSPDFSGVRKTDEFSVLLATVVNDTSILYTSALVPQKPEVNAEDKTAIVAVQKKDSLPPGHNISDTSQKKSIAIVPVVAASNQKPNATSSATKDVSSSNVSTGAAVIPVVAATKTDTTNKQSQQSISRVDSSAKKTGEVIKLQETTTANSLNITFLSKMDHQSDTVRISIPIDKVDEKAAVALSAPAAKNIDEKKSNTQNGSTVVMGSAAVTKTDSVQPKKVSGAPPPINDCKSYATEADVDKLRVKILAAKTNAEKIDAAKKVYKTRCFSVKQVRALSELFTTDEERFLFFEASYKSVSDAYNFKQLSSLLNDETYRNRLNEM